MNPISIIPPRLDDIKPLNGLLCLFNFEEKMPMQGISGLVDWRLLGQLSKLTINGFLSGQYKESVLVPLGDRMPLDHLLFTGTGLRSNLTQEHFCGAVTQMLHAATKLKQNNLTVALPGRPENIIDAAEAIDCFLSLLEEQSEPYSITIIDTYEVHQTILSEIERRRMKASVVPLPPGM